MLKIRIVQWPTAARLTRVAAVLLVALAPLAPLAPGALGVAQAQTAASKRPIERGPLVTAVDLRGVKHMDPKVLSLAILTRDSECRTLLYAPICLLTKSSQFYERHYLDALELRRDVLRLRLFYWRRGYRDTRVVTRTVPSSGGVRVIFDITEGPPTIVDQITVRGVDSIIPRRIVQATLQLKDNEPLDLLLLDSSAVKLRDEFFQRGYADAAIELDTGRVSDAANHGPVALIVHHGARNTVKAIEIEGNSRISERTIRRLLTFKAGDLYRRNSILESQRNLYLSGMFAEVEMRTPPPDSMAHVAQQRDSATAVVALSDS
ncbi:MAG: POTRA domain-containing protein, partial [Gemmatimonadaceae bacterium]